MFPWQLYRVNFLGGREETEKNTHNQFYKSFLRKPDRALFSHSLKFKKKREKERKITTLLH